MGCRISRTEVLAAPLTKEGDIPNWTAFAWVPFVRNRHGMTFNQVHRSSKAAAAGFKRMRRGPLMAWCHHPAIAGVWVIIRDPAGELWRLDCTEEFTD